LSSQDHAPAEGQGGAQSPKQAAGNKLDLTKLKVEKSCSRGLATWLSTNRVSLAISSYQTGRVYLVGSDREGRVSFFERIFERAMGIVGNAQRIYLGGLYQLVALRERAAPERGDPRQVRQVLRPAQRADDRRPGHPRARHPQRRARGVRQHQVFVPGRTEPDAQLQADLEADFISKLAPEDRCHLNGLAMVDGKPKYVTAVCKSDAVDGWRDRRMSGGVVIDVENRRDRVRRPVDAAFAALGQRQSCGCSTRARAPGLRGFRDKAFVPSAWFPGFLRGLSIVGNVAAVGLSKPRNQRFEGLQLDEN
jgi:predicted secreted protein